MNVRVRYAPSPTGFQHIGGLRTALFNYFFARRMGGQFILRIEDTDQARFEEEALEDLYTSLHWIGVDWDEGPRKGGAFGPYVQSERSDIYQQYAQELLVSGHAYECFCSTQRLERIRQIQEKNKLPPGYDRYCRQLNDEEREQHRKTGIRPVIRFKVPLEGETSFEDLLLGTIKRSNIDINPDPVLLKSDGLPTYHLANVIDDHLMEITHILRAQEWVSSGPLHVLLYKAFSWTPPLYCHLPMVLGADGQKLSKRHGSTAVRQFRQEGYLPEALLNYIMLIGWSLNGSREFFSREDFEDVFFLEGLNKSSGIFDYKKLDWFNAHYIHQLSPEDLLIRLKDFFLAASWSLELWEARKVRILEALPLITQRLTRLAEAPALLRFLFEDPQTWLLQDLLVPGKDVLQSIELLHLAHKVSQGYMERTSSESQALMQKAAEDQGLKVAALMIPLRVAVLGSKASPPLFDSLKLLGPELVERRLKKAITFLKENNVC